MACISQKASQALGAMGGRENSVHFGGGEPTRGVRELMHWFQESLRFHGSGWKGMLNKGRHPRGGSRSVTPRWQQGLDSPERE